jgi:hypothetical protein
MRTPVLVSLALAALCAGSLAHADKLPQGLNARYMALKKSIETVDLKTFATFYAPEYVTMDAKGNASKLPEYLAGIKSLMKGAKKRSSEWS